MMYRLGGENAVLSAQPCTDSLSQCEVCMCAGASARPEGDKGDDWSAVGCHFLDMANNCEATARNSPRYTKA